MQTCAFYGRAKASQSSNPSPAKPQELINRVFRSFISCVCLADRRDLNGPLFYNHDGDAGEGVFYSDMTYSVGGPDQNSPTLPLTDVDEEPFLQLSDLEFLALQNVRRPASTTPCLPVHGMSSA